MNNSISVIPRRYTVSKALIFTAVVTIVVCLASLLHAADADAQEAGPAGIRVGEKITFDVSFERYKNVAYAEIYAVSEGRLSDKNAIEIRGKIKTLNFFSAAFHFVDQTRTTFISTESGLPLYIEKSENGTGLPKETVFNFLPAPTPNADLLAMVYKIRNSGGTGAFNLQENGKIYPVAFQSTAAEKVKTDAGEFDTTVVAIQSEFFTENGIRDVRVNLSTDDAHIPAVIRFKTEKGEFRAAAASIQVIEPEVDVQPTPAAVQTPRPAPAPTPERTPAPYVENQPLAPELAFVLGETLNYQISTAGRPVGSFTMQAKQRKDFMGLDSLILKAAATESRPGNSLFVVGDSVEAVVNPETLVPFRVEIKFNGSLRTLNKTASWDPSTGSILYGTSHVEVPVGTQSILSLVYAIRSFNLKPSPVLSNPVNDTRVAVFWETKPYVFTLRPSQAELITLRGEKISAQLVNVTTGHPVLDQLQIKIWLGNDARRVPLRFSVGAYQADLVSESVVQPQ